MCRYYFCIKYDPNVFTEANADVHMGSLPLSGTGWHVTPNVNQTTGEMFIGLSSIDTISSTSGGILITIDFHVNAGAPLGASQINLLDTDSKGHQTMLFDGGFAQYTLDPAPTNAANDANIDAAFTVTDNHFPPVANNDTYSLTTGASFFMPARGVLANDTDPQASPLTAVNYSMPAHGTLTGNMDGSFTYAPTGNYLGTDSFTYQAQNSFGLTSAAATVNLTVTPTLSIPQNLAGTAGGTVTVPVNIDNPDPGGNGLTAANLAITYDPAAFTVSDADIQLGSVPLSGSGWSLSTSIGAGSNLGQLGIQLSSASPIMTPTPGSLVCIVFHIKGTATAGLHFIDLAANTAPNGSTITTSLVGSIGPIPLHPPPTNATNDPTDGSVIVAAATHFAFSATPTSATAGTAFNFTITALDGNNNPFPSYSGTVHFSSSDLQAELPMDTTLVNGTGTFSARLKTASDQTLSATDTVNTSLTGSSGPVTVSPSSATHFQVSAPASATAGDSFHFTVTALDAFQNTATDYNGTVQFSSSAGAVTLPSNSTLTNGTGSFSAILKSSGDQTITATDTVSNTITGKSNPITVSAAAATHFSVSAPASATAGTAFDFTVTALDAFENPATNYNGLVHFSSSDNAASLPSNSSFTNGSDTFSATFKNAGDQTLTAVDTVMSSITGLSNDIAVNAGAATHFSVVAPGIATAGSPASFSVTAEDAFDNAATGYSGTVHFTSSDGRAILPSNSPLANGMGTFNAIFKIAGNQTLTATDTASSSVTGTSDPIAVSAAAATHFSVIAPTSATAGISFSFTVTAQDFFNNTATGYSGTIHFTSSDGSATLPLNSMLNNGTGSFNGILKTAGTQTLTATDTVSSSITGMSNDIAVDASSTTHFSVSAPATTTAGIAINFTVTAQDQFNNTTPGYHGLVQFLSGDGNAALPVNSLLTNGVGTFSATLQTAGNQTITATDTVTSTISGASNTITVNAAAATHFTVSAPTSTTAGTAFNFTVTAQDQFDNTAKDYSGMVHFTSSDGAADLPSNTALSNGVGTLSATLKTAGIQTLTATDTVSNSITGISSAIMVIPGTATHFVFSSPTSATAGVAFSFSVTALDSLDNTATNYHGTVHFSGSDGAADLPSNSPLTNGSGSFSGTLKTAGDQTLTATDTFTSTITGTSNAVVVNAGSATHFQVDAPPGAFSGTAFNVNVIALDPFGNPATSYSGTVHFASSDSAAVLPANATLTNGTSTFRVTLVTSSVQTLTATDTVSSSITGASNFITVSTAAAAHFVLHATTSVSGGTTFQFSVTAVDSFGNVVTGYGGTVQFTSSDGKAKPPHDATLNNGVGFFSATLSSAGTQTLTATDTANTSVTGTTTIDVVAVESLFVATPDATGGPLVEVFDARTGTMKYAFNACDPAFQGGIRVALGDVNGDGATDIIVAFGPSGGPLIEVFNGTDLSLLTAFNAYDPNFRGGVFVAAADVNGDGVDEIITAPGTGGGALVEVFRVETGSPQFVMSFNAYDTAFLGGVHIAAGDTDGDGVAEIITAPGAGGGPLVEIWELSTGIPSVRSAFNAFDTTFLGGLYVAVGDVNGDGKQDIIAAANGASHIKVFDGPDNALLQSFFAFDPHFSGGARVAAVDCNGDGRADIIAAAGTGGLPAMTIVDALTLANLDTFFAFDPAFNGGLFVGGR